MDNEETRAKLVQRSTSNKKQCLTGGGRSSEFGTELVTNMKTYFDSSRDDNLPVQLLRPTVLTKGKCECTDLSFAVTVHTSVVEPMGCNMAPRYP